MRKIIVHMLTGYCGEDMYDAVGVDDDATNKEIDDVAAEMAYQHAEMYGRETEEELENVEGYWEDYVPDLHDMYRTGGGSFEEDF